MSELKFWFIKNEFLLHRLWDILAIVLLGTMVVGLYYNLPVLVTFGVGLALLITVVAGYGAMITQQDRENWKIVSRMKKMQ